MKTTSFSALALAALSISTVLSATSAQALDRRMRIINNTAYTMVSFQASNVRTRNWEEDMLGRSVVRSGGSFVANINDGTGFCMFDLRAKFEGGRTAERRGVNVCKMTSWTIHN